MREIIFDTETTGFNPYPQNGAEPDRIVEIGAIEIFDLKPTGRTFHQYINPERHIPAEVVKIHGIDNDKVVDSPKFRDIVNDWIAFVGDESQLVAHNAKFDMRFINAELSWCGKTAIDNNRVVDSLDLAKTRFPGQSNSLDALCDRFGVNNAHREFHGALLDSELLYEVYVELRGGRQQGFALDTDADTEVENTSQKTRPKRDFPIPEDELHAHEVFIQEKIKHALWTQKTI